METGWSLAFLPSHLEIPLLRLIQECNVNRLIDFDRKSAIRLTEFELDMDVKKIYSLLALAAYYNKSFKECARAFVKLENIEGISEEEKERYQNIAA